MARRQVRRSGRATYVSPAGDAATSVRRGRPARTYMLLLRKAHLGEVSVTVWPDELKEVCEERNMVVLD